MANLIRDNMPLVHSAIAAYLSDEISFHRYGAGSFETTASNLPPVGDEAVQQGNNIMLFMSLSQCAGTAPTTQDRTTKNGLEYRITDVVADDYDGFNLSLRKT